MKPKDIHGLLTKSDLSENHIDLNRSNTIELENISSQYRNILDQIGMLSKQRGIISRKIGEAKRSEISAQDLIDKTKAYSKEINALKERQAELKASAEAILSVADYAEKAQPSLPPYFRNNNAVYNQPTAESLKVVSVPEILHPSWNEYVDSHPESSVYHRIEFKRIIENSFGHKTYFLAAISDNNKIYGVLPAVQLKSKLFGNFIVSIPFFNYGGPLGDDQKIEQLLINELANIAKSKQVDHIELRDTFSRPKLAQKTEKNSLVLSLPKSPNVLWDHIGTKVRAQVKKAKAFNLTFKVGKHKLLDDFYYVFSVNMRDLGTPVYSKRFFLNLLNEDKIDTSITIAYMDNAPVSCGFLIHYKDTTEIPWASTLKQANRYNANMFLYWNILTHVMNNGSRYFDFGRSSRDAGTFKFKTQWGAKPRQLYWHYVLNNIGELPEINPNNPKYRLAIAIWQKLPVLVTRFIGPKIVKYLP